MTQTAKLFNTGRGQAVRLPKTFRFEGKEVFIRKEGDRVMLSQWKRDKIAGRDFERVQRDPKQLCSLSSLTS